jgi:type IV pilus assembly protein PilB
MKLTNTKFLDFLVESELVEEEEASHYLTRAENEDANLYEYVLTNDLIERDKLGKKLAEKNDVKYKQLSENEIDSEVVKMIPEVLAQKHNSIAFVKDDNVIKLALHNPKNDDFIEQAKRKIRQSDDIDAGELEFEIYFAHKDKIRKIINTEYNSSNDQFSQMIEEIIQQEGEDADPEDVPIIRIVDELLNYAYENGASDVHVEPYEDQTLIRFRIDGILHDIISIPKSLHELIVTRIKILARLRTDEHRAAQDGKLKFSHEGEDIDVRVSIVPIVYGEKVVMRLLAENAGQFTLDSLGFRDQDLAKIQENIDKPWGMILATGPTGSGKTTTLYSIIKELNTREVNISTIEDPVEYGIESINQIQVNEETNLTFSNGLRAIVRQDPDIVMVGEIRDEETAQIAVNAAMTGHLVLSTLHTNDAATTLPRLLDMGVQPFLVSSTINITVAQRLVRKICEDCKVEQEIDKETENVIKKELSEELMEKYELKAGESKLYQGEGCPSCQQSGYQGREGVYEVLNMTSDLKDMVMEQENAEEIKDQAVENGMLPLIEAGLKKVKNGHTTLEELLRVIQE